MSTKMPHSTFEHRPLRIMYGAYLRAKYPSSSSLRVRAGKGAPGFSSVGNLTPPEANGLNDWIFERIGVVDDVRTGRSGSRRLQPKEFMESRKEVDAILKGRWRCLQ